MSAALFKKKELKPCERVCFRLKQLREEKGITIAELSSKTNISRLHIEAIEACQFDKLPEGAIYRKNFVRRYLEALGVDPSSYIKQFNEEERPTTAPKEPSVKKESYFLQFGNIPATIRLCSVIFLLLGVGGYLGFQVKRIVEPPKLTVLSPQDGLVSTEEKVVVKGATEKEASVTINGETIQNSEKGTFEQPINLSPGLNTITITAKKKHGKTTQETIYLVLRENSEEI